MDVSNDTITPRTLIRGYMDNNDTVATSTPRMLRSHQHAGLDNDSKHSPQSMLLSNEQQVGAFRTTIELCNISSSPFFIISS